MSPTPKIPVTGELWLNADGFPQLTIDLPEGGKMWLQVPTRDTLRNPRASKAHRAAMKALGVEESARNEGRPERGSDEVLRHKILKLRKQGREWADIAVDIGLATERANLHTKLNSLGRSEVARAIQREELNDLLRAGNMYGDPT